MRSLKAAVAEQLASAKRNFEVGTSTIVDTRDAQARYDLTVAQELAADNDLRVKSLALDQLVGKSGTSPKPLRTTATLPEVQPANVNQWVPQSEVQNPLIKQTSRRQRNSVRVGHIGRHQLERESHGCQLCWVRWSG